MEKSKIYFSEFLIGVGSSPVWTLTNVGIKSIVIEEKLFPYTLIGVVFISGLFNITELCLLTTIKFYVVIIIF